MSYLLNKFLKKVEFESYEDFRENYEVTCPDNFNFGFDVVDAWAEYDPSKMALVWTNDHGEEHFFTFTDVKNTVIKFVITLKA